MEPPQARPIVADSITSPLGETPWDINGSATRTESRTAGSDPPVGPGADGTPAPNVVATLHHGEGDRPQCASTDDREARFEALIRAWWLDERPAWTAPDWWDAPLRDEVRALLWLPAGPQLATAVAGVERGGRCPHPHAGEAWPGLPPPGHHPGWPCACMVVLAAAWEACTAWCSAGAAVALVDAAGPDQVRLSLPGAGREIVDPAREELAPALRATPGSMHNRIDAARGIVAHPRLVALVSTAAISAWAARLVVLEVADLTVELANQVVEHVCERISRRLTSGRRAWTSAEVGRLTRITRRRICPDSDRPARERAYERRRVRVYPDKNGMAVLVADLAETDAQRIRLRIAAIAHGLKDPDDSRTCDQVRADVLVDLLLGPVGIPPRDSDERSASSDDAPGSPAPGSPAPGTSAAPGSPGTAAAAASGCARPEIQVIVPLATILGLAEDPADVPGMGPIPAELARELAADGRWRAWITDAAGAVVATGSSGYVPSAGLARLVRAREPYCRMPGCRQVAQRCDLDHAIPYPRGETSAVNLGPLCRRHHVMKTHAGWALEPTACPTCHDVDEAEHQGSGPAHGEATGVPAPGWQWRTPAGFVITDHPSPALLEPVATGGRRRRVPTEQTGEPSDGRGRRTANILR